jgi:hypothetical protein
MITKEFLKAELDKLDRNTFGSVCLIGYNKVVYSHNTIFYESAI